MNYKIGIVAPEEIRFLEDKVKQYKATPPEIPVFVGHPELPGAKRYSELSEREITEIYKSYIDTTLEAVENFNPDLLHIHHLSLIAWVGRYIAAIKGIKYIITSHGSDLYDITKDKRYLPICEGAVKNAKAVTVNSGYTKSKFLKTFGRQYAKITHIIPGGVDINSFPPQMDTSAFDDKHNTHGKKIVLFTGRLISHKGVKYLVHAAKDINGEIFVVGDGPEKTYLLNLIEQKKIANVHLVGYKNGQELLQFYYRADVFVAPSVWDEPLGLTILETMAASKPVVATKKGGIPLLIKHGYNGFLIPARNSKEIVQACNKLLADEELKKKMGENARKTVVEKFTWNKIAMKFHRLYQKVGSNNGKKK